MFHVNIAQAEAERKAIEDELDPTKLRRIADELGQLSRILALNTIVPTSSSIGSDSSSKSIELPSASSLRSIIRNRRLRDNYFGAELLADPAWDILLELLAAKIDHKKVQVSSLTIAANVPPTTALRWISAMTKDGLLTRESDPYDGRRFYIGLTDKAVSALAEYFSRIELIPSTII